MRPPAPPTLATTAIRRNPWIGVLTSVLIHGSIVTAIVWSEAGPDFFLKPSADSVAVAMQQAKEVGMVYLPPPAPSNVDGRNRTPPRRPDPPVVETPPEPEVEAPAPVTRGDEGARSEEDNVPADGGASAPTTVPDGFAVPNPPTETPRRRNPSIAFRGGTPGSSRVTQTDTTPAGRRPPTLAGATPRCQPGPPRRASDPVDWGVVAGRVYQLGSTVPLAGATLQVLGTNYTTTSDDNGDYVLRFDTWPLKNCEQQYVRVQLDGFVAQTLTLTMGVTSRSDVSLRGR